MIDCLFKPVKRGEFRCRFCSWTYRGPKAPRRNCPVGSEAVKAECGKAAKLLGIPHAEIPRYAAALVAWNDEGRPFRSTDEAAWILADLCGKCKHLDGDRCGCCQAGGLPPLAIAVRMETVGCPAMKW